MNVPIATAQIITAKLRPNPVLSLSADHLDLLGTGFSDENGAGPPEYSARTDFLLERGGKRQARTDTATAARTVVEFQLLDTIRGLVLDVQSAFVDTLLASDSLKLAEESLRNFNEIVDVNARRLKAGDLSEVEFIRVSVAALQFKNVVDQAELRLQASVNRLQFLLGRPDFAVRLEAVGPMRSAGPDLELAGLRAAALDRRPDLRAARSDQVRSEAELRLQQAQGKVDYSVGSEYRRQQGLAGMGNSLGFFFSAPLPVWNRNQGEIERARLERQQTALRTRGVEQSVAAEIDVAWKQYQTAKRLMERYEQDLLKRARDVRQITEFSYRRGEASFLELLDAQRVFNETMQGYNESRADLARSLYVLDAASGKAVNP
jgi:cobalt-zinc-cadmium efflux system outer membrane protein